MQDFEKLKPKNLVVHNATFLVRSKEVEMILPQPFADAALGLKHAAKNTSFTVGLPTFDENDKKVNITIRSGTLVRVKLVGTLYELDSKSSWLQGEIGLDISSIIFLIFVLLISLWVAPIMILPIAYFAQFVGIVLINHRRSILVKFIQAAL